MESLAASPHLWLQFPTMRIPPIGFFLVENGGAVPCRAASSGFMVASDGVPFEGYGDGGSGVCVGDGQTDDEGVPSQGGRGDALFRRMAPYLT